MTSLRGTLLVASPTLVDPNFARTVVLIAEHSDEGAMGLVLNRPSEALVAESVDELDAIVDPSAQVFIGGPVQEQSVMVLAEFDDIEQSAAVVIGPIGFLPAGADLSALAPGVHRARVFAGHAGWGPGQLEDELSEGAWITAPSVADEIFSEDPEDLWATVLERKGGAYALLARMPADPSVN